MTREKAIEILRLLQTEEDVESAHHEGDKILCALLTSLGETEVVEAWKAIPKWYA